MGLIITINGTPGSGKSSVGKLLAAKLGIPFISMGEIRRQYALAHGITLVEANKRAEQNTPSTGDISASDAQTDAFQSTLPERYESFVLDSRLGYYFVPQSFKIHITVSVEEGAKRIFAEHRASEHWETLDDATRALRQREIDDRARYLRLYHVDTKEGPYDLVVDSSGCVPEQVVEKILPHLPQHEKHL